MVRCIYKKDHVLKMSNYIHLFWVYFSYIDIIWYRKSNLVSIIWDRSALVRDKEEIMKRQTMLKGWLTFSYEFRFYSRVYNVMKNLMNARNSTQFITVVSCLVSTCLFWYSWYKSIKRVILSSHLLQYIQFYWNILN